jgi:hypothetical protein
VCTEVCTEAWTHLVAGEMVNELRHLLVAVSRTLGVCVARSESLGVKPAAARCFNICKAIALEIPPRGLRV